jgi:hypothetical protein
MNLPPSQDIFDPVNWDLSDSPTQNSPMQPTPTTTPARFLKGPVPWPWISRANQLPGKALMLGLLLWHHKGLRKSNTFTFCLKRAVEESIPRSTARRALRHLQAAGLITIEHRPGRALIVTIL